MHDAYAALISRRVATSFSAKTERFVHIATVQCRAGRQDLLWVSNLQTTQFAAQSTVIRVQGQQHDNRIQVHLALGGSFESPAVDSASPQSRADEAER